MATSGFPPIAIEPGAQVAQFTLVLAKNDVAIACFLLVDAMTRIANGSGVNNPRQYAENAIELIATAFGITPPASASTDPNGSTPPANGTPPAAG